MIDKEPVENYLTSSLVGSSEIALYASMFKSRDLG